MTNPKLVRRIKRPNPEMVDNTYKYYPHEVTRVAGLKPGSAVKVTSPPVGEGKNMFVEVRYYDRETRKYHMYNVFVGDLAMR